MNSPDGQQASRDSSEFLAAPLSDAGYAELFSRYAPRVKGFLLRRGLQSTVAEEVTQEVMLTVWRKAELYDVTRAPVRTWVFTIARNRCIDLLRRGGRPAPDPDDPCWVETMHSPEGPEAHAVSRSQEEQVRTALQQLDDGQRDVLSQVYFKGQTTTEAAAALGLPVGTIKSRTRRGLKALRSHLLAGGADDA